MVPAKFLTAVTAVPIFSSLTAAVDVQSKTNVAVYYGQGANQKRLSHFCEETSLDIINIGFVNIFPDQSLTGWPGSNFGNQCDGLTFTIGGLTSGLLSGCHQLEEDIPKCQAAGKIVMLSLGGAYPTDQEIKSEESALAFADFLWGAFGPKIDDWIGVNGPRPFGDVVVDGFDFDIEHNGGFGYATMINRFRWHFAHYPERKFYISGAPQCSIPDPQLSDAIQNAAFDFIWVQFYNTDGCSARNFVDGTGNPGFNFDQWVEVIKKGGNPSAKLFVGLPASPHAANPGFYLTPAEVRPLITKYMGLYPETFGGVMLWEATASDLNRIAGGSYADNMKRILYDCAPPVVTTTHSSARTPSSTPASSSIPMTSSTSVSSSTTIIVSTPKHSTATTSSRTRKHSTTTTSTRMPKHSTTSTPSSTLKHGNTTTPSSTQKLTTNTVPTRTPKNSSTRSMSKNSTTSSSSTLKHSTATTPTRTPEHSTTPVSSSSRSSIVATPSVSSKTSFSTRSSSATRAPSHISSFLSSSVVLTTAPSSSSIPTSSSSSSSKSKPMAVTPSASVTRKITTSKIYSNSTATISYSGSSTRVTSFPITSNATITTAGPKPSSPSSELATVTTVVVTSYIDICPTGFTTITTTYTTTYCPGTVSAIATPTAPPTGPVTQVPAPSPPPEGWTTSVTVCYHCAPTPTTVTLTVPCTATTTADSVSTKPSAPPVSADLPSEGVTKSATSTNVIVSTVVVIPVPPSSGLALPSGTGGLWPTTFSVLPSSGGPHVPVAPAASQSSGSVPVFTGAASHAVMDNLHVAIVAGVAVLAFALT